MSERAPGVRRQGLYPCEAEIARRLSQSEKYWRRIRLAAAEPPGAYAPGHRSEADTIRKGYGNVEAAFDTAHAVIELDLVVGRHSGVPLETRWALARYNPSADVIELYGAAKVPHATRDVLARVLGRSPASVHLCEGHVGGGFDIRGEL